MKVAIVALVALAATAAAQVRAGDIGDRARAILEYSRAPPPSFPLAATQLQLPNGVDSIAAAPGDVATATRFPGRARRTTHTGWILGVFCTSLAIDAALRDYLPAFLPPRTPLFGGPAILWTASV